MSYKVFLSHAWADRWLAEQIGRRIESDCRASVFIDVFDVKKGDDIEDRIFEGMRSIDELVVLLTPWSIDRNWLWVENRRRASLGAADCADPLSGDVGTLDTKGGPTFLRAKNMVDVNELETYLTELHDRVREHGHG